MKTTNPRRMLTLAEVAEELAITYQHAHTLATGGRLPAIRVGKFWRVCPDRLAAFRRGELEPGDE